MFVRQHSERSVCGMGQYSSIFLLPEGAGLANWRGVVARQHNRVGVSFIARLILIVEVFLWVKFSADANHHHW